VSGKRTRFAPPMLMFRIFAHNWRDTEFFPDLAIYPGPDILAVKQDPEEFIRDNMVLVKAIESRRVA
jgi:hypothetical protein